MQLLRITLVAQSVYYFLTALWPLIHIKSFMEITGPKTDLWLVKTVAVLLLAISVSFFVSLYNKSYNNAVIILAISCCILLTIIDCYYELNNAISKIYLLDALVEIILLVLWIVSLTGTKKIFDK